MGEFSDRRWQAAVKKLLAREYAVASITAQTPASPNEQIWLTTHVNPPGTDDGRVSGTVEVMASLSYLRRLIAFPDRVEALLQLGIAAWNGIDGGPAYGYANLAISPPRAMFPQWSRRAPARRCRGSRSRRPPSARIRSPNYLTAGHVALAGGKPRLRAALAVMRIEPLGHGGLLVVATDSPLPDDTPDTGDRFPRLHAAVQPAFLSREETSDNKRAMLGHFYRERREVMP